MSAEMEVFHYLEVLNARVRTEVQQPEAFGL